MRLAPRGAKTQGRRFGVGEFGAVERGEHLWPMRFSPRAALSYCAKRIASGRPTCFCLVTLFIYLFTLVWQLGMVWGAYDFDPKHSSDKSTRRPSWGCPAAAKPRCSRSPCASDGAGSSPSWLSVRGRGGITRIPREQPGSCLLGTFGIPTKP